MNRAVFLNEQTFYIELIEKRERLSLLFTIGSNILFSMNIVIEVLEHSVLREKCEF